MMIKVPSVLGPQQLSAVTELMSVAGFVDGKLTAGMAASRIKQNEEVSNSSPHYAQMRELVMGNLMRHPAFRNAVLPHKMSDPIFARYGAGMAYGDHIDDPVMGAPHHFRTDVSFTVFLNDPEDYEGGDLVVYTSFGEQRVRLPAGHAVIYPSGSLHKVEEVTGGERQVMVGWVQSMIRDPGKRELLFELNQVRERRLRKQPDDADTKKIDHVYINLVRMWAEV